MNDNARIFLSLIVAAAFFLILFNRVLPQPADTLYVNAVVHTMDEENTVANAFAVRGDRLVGVGDREQLEERFDPKEIVDLDGKPVYPGLIDAHGHVFSLGISKITVDLLGTTSPQEVASRVKERVAKVEPGTWVRGRGWDQNDWKVTKFPEHAVLDRVSPNNPVYLTRVDGHAGWANKAALDIAGITKDTPDPEGGRIIRDAKGNPTGVFVDDAQTLILSQLPPLSDEEAAEALHLAMNELVKDGLTEGHDMGIDSQEFKIYKEFADSGKLPVRIYAMVGGTKGELWQEFLKTGPLIGYGNHHLTVRGLKLYADGALGSRGAALIDPYTDDPTNRGLTVTTQQDLEQGVQDALAHGFQVSTHAIGDRGNNIVLNIYENALKQYPGSDRRLRVEHAQVLAPDDIPRFKQLGVVPSMQETHCTSDMYWAEARLGPVRVRGAYAWRSLLNTGVVIPGGSDFPVEDPNPMFGIYAGVTRQDQQGMPRNADDVRKYFQLSSAGVTDPAAFNGGWYVGQKLTREEAIRSFTTWAAWAGFEEDLKGSIAPGKLADFVVLSADIMTIPASEIFKTKVEMTVVGGKTVYQRVPESPPLAGK